MMGRLRYIRSAATREVVEAHVHMADAACKAPAELAEFIDALYFAEAPGGAWDLVEAPVAGMLALLEAVGAYRDRGPRSAVRARRYRDKLARGLVPPPGALWYPPGQPLEAIDGRHRLLAAANSGRAHARWWIPAGHYRRLDRELRELSSYPDPGDDPCASPPPATTSTGEPKRAISASSPS